MPASGCFAIVYLSRRNCGLGKPVSDRRFGELAAFEEWRQRLQTRYLVAVFSGSAMNDDDHQRRLPFGPGGQREKALIRED